MKPSLNTLHVNAKGAFDHDVVSRFATFINNRGTVISSTFVAGKGDEPSRLRMEFTSPASASDFAGFFAGILRSVRLDPSIVTVTDA